MSKNIIDIEIELLLTAIFEKYGYDFRDYSKASIRRRIFNFIDEKKISSIGELIHIILSDKKIFSELVHAISVTVTEMFRDPQVYSAIRNIIIPYLKTYPSINIWHAGCATGQEVYSLARDWFRPHWNEHVQESGDPVYVESKSHYKNLCKENGVRARCLM